MNYKQVNTISAEVRARIDAGAEAIEKINNGSHFEDWMIIARGLHDLQNEAMTLSYSSSKQGGGYASQFSALIKDSAYVKYEGQKKKSFRSWASFCAENETGIREWRNALSSDKRDEWNSPTTVGRKYKAYLQELQEEQRIANGGAPKEKKPSPVASLKAANFDLEDTISELTKENKQLKKEISAGSLFEWDDTGDQIAIAMVEHSKSKAEKVARKILQLIKQANQSKK